MKIQWALLLSLGIVAQAANAVVIDAQSMEPQSTNKNATAAPQAAPAAAAANSNEERDRLMKAARVSPREKAQLAKSAAGEANLQEGIDFLAANQKKKGVVSLPSGVQYRVIAAGKGKKKATEANKVVVRYVGSLIDGTTFDKTDDKKPATFNLNGFRPGLREAIQLMTSGAKWEVVVPPELGFGAAGYHGVAPNAVLVYQVSLISIK